MPLRGPPRPRMRIAHWTVTTAAGTGRDAFARALAANASALRHDDFSRAGLDTWIGRVEAVEALQLPAALQALDARVTRLAWLALQADGFAEAVRRAAARVGSQRVGVVLGTSTSSIAESEAAYRRHAETGGFSPQDLRPDLHHLHAPAAFVQQALGLDGLSLTVSTACASSAKAFAVARGWLQAGLAEAVVVGGVDSLCESTLHGFGALQLLAPNPCRPFGADRQGISIGEAAGFALLERDEGLGPRLLGIGESSDAHHMSAPHPEGRGARTAMHAALEDSGLAPDAIDFVHLHGTGTRLNDATEAAAVAGLLPHAPHAASTKGCTGHTLGAAGILGAAACWLALEQGLRAGTANAAAVDPALPLALALRCAPAFAPTRHALANAFGFGGSNVSLVFGHG